MKKIVFFNHANMGDVFLSRPFVSEIINKYNVEIEYAHKYGEYFLKDLNIKYIPINELSNINQSKKFYLFDNVVYINTWIGCYFNPSKPFHGECNLNSIYNLIYLEAFSNISKVFNEEITLNKILNYFPTVNYSYFNTDGVNNFLKFNKYKKTILICNGPALSGQCDYNGNLEEIIYKLVNKYKDYCFITTDRLNYEFDNLKYTGDITKVNGIDIIEISYLSKFCDLIVGRSSGPFTLSNLRENIFDENKTFLCFGKRETDCLPYNLDIKCSFIFDCFSSIQNLENTIMETLEEI